MYPKQLQSNTLGAKVYTISLVVMVLLWLIPIFAMMILASRPLDDIIAGNYWGYPTKLAFFSNIKEVFASTAMLEFMFNSLIVSVATMIGAVFLASLSSYALTKLRLPYANVMFFIFVGGNFVPFQILMIPVQDLLDSLNLLDTLIGLIIFHVAFQSGFCTLFMRNFMSTIPDSLIQSARVEGASEFIIFFRIILPMMRPALASLCVLIFTFIWNDYFWVLVLTKSSETMTVTSGLDSLKGQWVSSWNLMATGALIAALPPILMFFLMQKHFTRGLTIAVKK